MRILHTSDWHLGKRLENYSRHEEQVGVLNEICEIAERESADAVIISGDLFDTFNPPAESVDIFYKYLKQLAAGGRRPVIAIAGNHDSPERIEAPDPLARECGILFTGYPNSTIEEFSLDSGMQVLRSMEGFVEIKLPSSRYPLRILLTPFANELRLRKFLGCENSNEEFARHLKEKWRTLADKYCDQRGVNLLAAHLFFAQRDQDIPEEPEDERPILHVGGAEIIYADNIPPQVQYAALGHLHRKQYIAHEPCPVVYSGSPVSYSFSEANQNKYVMLIEAEPGQAVSIKEIELTSGKKLIRKKAESVESAVRWLADNRNCLVELTIVSDTYLTAENRRALYNAHDGIITIIPDISDMSFLNGDGKAAIDLSKDMESLFIDYFTNEKGQKPDDELLAIFREVISGEETL